MIELFFDLFFVANLATFTAYHEITDGESVLAYIGLCVCCSNRDHG
jgi:low temperature requirement protein LtrA